VSALQAGVGSTIFTICDHKIFAANDALPGFRGPLRALFAIARELFFSGCQIIFVVAGPPIFLEMLRRAGLGVLPRNKIVPADFALPDIGWSRLSLLSEDFF